ncbi:MAG: hypothetical protein M3P18_23560 [Actinomycetota bacterium]|nr:hypothetical protein [Actinomycetota bacterium]
MTHRAFWVSTRAVALVAVLLIALPARGQERRSFLHVDDQILPAMSQSVAIKYWEAHPAQAPPYLRSRLRMLSTQRTLGAATSGLAPVTGDRFNLDNTGLPQNEESVTACGPDGKVVLGGTNDYRGLLADPRHQNFTGWSLSTDGGLSVRNEGLLPDLRFPDGRRVPSGGDPVDVADSACHLFAGTLNYNFNTALAPERPHSGVGVYRSGANVLAACPRGADPSCWPLKKVVAVAPRHHFYDKEWIDVGSSGSAGEVVWVVFTDFRSPFQSSIKAVRCGARLRKCTRPIKISSKLNGPGLPFAQFPDVKIGPDGRTYILWTEIHHGLFPSGATHMVHKLRVAPAGSTSFGPARVVARETRPLWNKNPLHANDFRVATIPKLTVMTVGSQAKIFVTWERCRFLDPQVAGGVEPPPTVCEEPQVVLTSSRSSGRTWSSPTVLSVGGDNYFPTIASDGSGDLAVAWYTSRFDRVFHNRQDVELVTLDPKSKRVVTRRRVTKVSNEPEADPTVFGYFIGDYFQAFVLDGSAYVHFNANYRSTYFLGRGLPIPQQDNFLRRVSL